MPSMALGVFSRLGRVRVTVAYAATLVAVSAVLLILGPYVQDRVLRHASTNLHNLAHGHFGTLLGSAFVVEAGPMWVWLPGLICLLAVCETLFGSLRLIVAFAVGHIGATLLVAAGLAVAVESHWQAASVARAIDVGMSYGAAGALGALTGAVPRRWRWRWVAWWVVVALVAGNVVAWTAALGVTPLGRQPAASLDADTTVPVDVNEVGETTRTITATADATDAANGYK